MLRILLIDDDKDLCQLTQKVLVMQGYLVDAFSDATTGIKHAKANKPNLILMDIMLPGDSGPEIINDLKKDPQFKAVPVVFLSGLVSGNSAEAQEGIMVGGHNYPTIGKPYEIEQLLSMVLKYIK